MKVFKAAIDAVKLWVNNPWLFLISIALDAVFLILYGFITFPIKDTIVKHILVVGAIASNSARDASQASFQGAGFFGGLFTEQSLPYVSKIVLLVCLLGLATYLTFVLLQSPQWWLARKKGKLVDFMADFAKITIPFAVIIGALSLIGLLVSMRDAVSNGSSDWLFTAATVLIAWIAVWCFGTMKAGWLAPFKAWRVTIPATLVILVVGIAANFAIVGLSFLNSTLALTIGALLLLPLLAWTRAYVVEVSNGLDA